MRSPHFRAGFASARLHPKTLSCGREYSVAYQRVRVRRAILEAPFSLQRKKKRIARPEARRRGSAIACRYSSRPRNVISEKCQSRVLLEGRRSCPRLGRIRKCSATSRRVLAPRGRLSESPPRLARVWARDRLSPQFPACSSTCCCSRPRHLRSPEL